MKIFAKIFPKFCKICRKIFPIFADFAENPVFYDFFFRANFYLKTLILPKNAKKLQKVGGPKLQIFDFREFFVIFGEFLFKNIDFLPQKNAIFWGVPGQIYPSFLYSPPGGGGGAQFSTKFDFRGFLLFTKKSKI